MLTVVPKYGENKAKKGEKWHFWVAENLVK
jgi:hypothetical protein